MFSHVFLAQTAGEMMQFPTTKTAYMACHFSPYGNGLSNMPELLPAGSMLLLDDSMPPKGHDPKVVERELEELIERFRITAVLLDFQDQMYKECMDMVRHLVKALPCPVAVTECYVKELHCPVFLSPTPVNMALQDYIAPWLQQGVYLEIAPEAVQFTVTENGSISLPVHCTETLPLSDERLFCHYNVEVFPEKAVFTLQRTKEDLAALVEKANQLGVRGTVGLYQELYQI